MDAPKPAPPPESLHVFARILEGQEWAPLRAAMTPRRYAPGECILAHGALQPDFEIICEGEAAVSAMRLQGGRLELSRLGRADCIGDMALLTGEPASADIHATTSVASLAISQQDLATLGPVRAKLIEALSVVLASRLQRANQRLLSEHAAAVHVLAVAQAHAPLFGQLPREVARVTGSRVLVVSDTTFLEQVQRVGHPDVDVKISAMDDRRDVLSIVDALAHEYPNIIVVCEPGVFSDPDLIRANILRAEPEDSIGNITPTSGERFVALSDRPWTHSNVTALAKEFDRPVVGIIPVSSNGDHGVALTKLARVMTGIQIGVAFGAGAAKGFAHIGVLRRFEELGLPIDVVTGSSIGAAIAAGCAVGLSVEELSETVARIAAKAIRPTVPVQSFLSNRAVREELKGLGVRMRFEDLQLPLGIVTTDIYRRCEVTFSRGLIWPGLLASMALPGIYPPLPVRGGYLVDGGVLNPVPARQARHLGAGVVIGVRLVGTKSNGGSAPRGRPLAPEIIMRSMELMYSRLSEISHNQADVTIEVSLEGGGIGDFKRKDVYIQAGYAAAVAANESIVEAIPLVARTA